MARIISLINQKGGVGKTTTVFNLGCGLARHRRSVLLIDLDPQANLTAWAGLSDADPSITDLFTDSIKIDRVIHAGIEGRPDVAPVSNELAGIDVVLASKIGREQRLKKAIGPIVDRYDYIIIDCPPSLGLLTINAMVASKEVIIPVQSKVMALSGIVPLIETVALVRDSYNGGLAVTGVIACMYDTRTNLSREVLDDLKTADMTKRILFKSVIRENVRLAEAPSYEQSIFDYSPDSHGATDYEKLTKELIKMES